MENLHRICHIGILVAVTAFATWLMTMHGLVLAQPSSIVAAVNTLSTSQAVDSERIRYLEKQIADVKIQVEDNGKSLAAIQSVGATLVAGVGLLSLLGLLTKKKS